LVISSRLEIAASGGFFRVPLARARAAFTPLEMNGKKEHRAWGIKPRAGVGSFANQAPKCESAARYENENFRTHRRVKVSVVSAIRGLWCDWPARWLRIRTVFSGGVGPAAAASRRPPSHGVFFTGSRRSDPAGTTDDRSRGSQSSGWKLDRCHATATGGAVGNDDTASVVESCMGPWILDVEEQSVPVDGRSLGSPAACRRRVDSAALAA